MPRVLAKYSATVVFPHPAGPVTSQMCCCSLVLWPLTATELSDGGAAVIGEELVGVAWRDGGKAMEVGDLDALMGRGVES